MSEKFSSDLRFPHEVFKLSQDADADAVDDDDDGQWWVWKQTKMWVPMRNLWIYECVCVCWLKYTAKLWRLWVDLVWEAMWDENEERPSASSKMKVVKNELTSQ